MAERPFVVRRVEILLDYYLSTIDDGSARGHKISFLLKKLMNEALEEFALMDTPPEMLEHYLRQSSAMLWWGATGENIANVPLPPSFLTPDQMAEISQLDQRKLTQAELRAALLEMGETVDGTELREAELAALEAGSENE